MCCVQQTHTVRHNCYYKPPDSQDSGWKIHCAFSQDHIVVISWKSINKNVRIIFKSEFNFHTPLEFSQEWVLWAWVCIYVYIYMDIVDDVFKRLSVIGCDIWLTAGRWWFVIASILTVCHCNKQSVNKNISVDFLSLQCDWSVWTSCDHAHLCSVTAGVMLIDSCWAWSGRGLCPESVDCGWFWVALVEMALVSLYFWHIAG